MEVSWDYLSDGQEEVSVSYWALFMAVTLWKLRNYGKYDFQQGEVGSSC